MSPRKFENATRVNAGAQHLESCPGCFQPNGDDFNGKGRTWHGSLSGRILQFVRARL
jgi:hypothetical protein